MQAMILGDGGMGRALADLLSGEGDTVVAVRGRPAGGTHPALAFGGVDVTFDFSAADGVLANAAAAVAGGCSRLVIGTTAWESERPAIDALLREAGATAVAASNFSPGVALFFRLVEEAARLFGSLEAYDPFILEWHRRSKADRPSGTAKELSRRLLAAHPRKRRLADPRRDGAAGPEELEVVSLRAGAAPGMHLVGFDAPGETIELRLTARDRVAYAAGALAAARWLLAARRTAGVHSFDEVLADAVPSTAVSTRVHSSSAPEAPGAGGALPGRRTSTADAPDPAPAPPAPDVRVPHATSVRRASRRPADPEGVLR